jgi:hypothetical protein
MANPNIVAVSNIKGKTAVSLVPSTATALVENLTNSNKVIKINTLMVANKHSTIVLFTASLRRNSVDYDLAYGVNIPQNSSLDLISKSIYLEEGDSLMISADVDAVSTVVCSYEEIA